MLMSSNNLQVKDESLGFKVESRLGGANVTLGC